MRSLKFIIKNFSFYKFISTFLGSFQQLSSSPICQVSPRENLEKESKKENEETKEKLNEADEEEELKNRILSAGLSHVGKHGWTRLALAAGAESAGYISVVSGLFPRDEELVFYHISECNSRLDTWMEEQVQEYKVTFLFR